MTTDDGHQNQPEPRQGVLQTRLHLPHSAPPELKVLDLFAGIGGISIGFSDENYAVVGVDVEEVSADVFEINGIGEHVKKDLRTESVIRDVPVVVGGPPCRPWSAVNLQKRGQAHEDHALLHRFFDHVREMRPLVFLMENVPPLMNDPEFVREKTALEGEGYSVASQVLRYSEFGAATTRRRLFTFGIREPLTWSAADFFQHLKREKRPGSTVESAIGWLSAEARGAVPDHDWSEFKTIGKYRDRYESGQYGWKRLEWDRPAPSFGSVAKTYILHPDSDVGGSESRVLSVREVLSIMGFRRDFHFPPGTARNRRYRMAANSVAPPVAAACARVIRRLLWPGTIPDSQRPKQSTTARDLTNNSPTTRER